MTFFPVIELVDRYAIAYVKQEKGCSNFEEFDYYTQALESYDVNNIKKDLQDLIDIHRKIWSLESELKSGRDHELPLEEIGRRAIEIRNHNNRRVALKNLMAEKLGCKVREIKQDHLSQ